MNGFFTDIFAVWHSVSQGFGISQLLYVLYIEMFAEKIRREKFISGIKLPGAREEAKISQYPDDTIIVITNLFSGQKVFKITSDFGAASGSLLNMKKCWVFGWGPGGIEQMHLLPLIGQIKRIRYAGFKLGMGTL